MCPRRRRAQDGRARGQPSQDWRRRHEHVTVWTGRDSWQGAFPPSRPSPPRHDRVLQPATHEGEAGGRLSFPSARGRRPRPLRRAPSFGPKPSLQRAAGCQGGDAVLRVHPRLHVLDQLHADHAQLLHRLAASGWGVMERVGRASQPATVWDHGLMSSLPRHASPLSLPRHPPQWPCGSWCKQAQ
ncbi:hypothetical protein F751_3228 [Auxenochlorella protothecoides]|uniref:Uncharacterized protein n=1 Tax=Auxenochlorella protothecoides TaxID=3075 RepID=A0A087SFK6_AUXPR|nr:hypothetical protein F751_3228 [Auxenochlorella protothecoides]KFM24510.1 hypothetical protein F751_3228 [Auxenochlorella protothecoides]